MIKKFKKLTEENKKEIKDSIKCTETKQQEEIEALMDSIIYENKEALSKLAK